MSFSFTENNHFPTSQYCMRSQDTPLIQLLLAACLIKKQVQFSDFMGNDNQ